MFEKAFHTTDISKKSFLVTGGAGFIGSNIVAYLLKHNAGKVVVLDNLQTGFEHNLTAFNSDDRFQFIKGDICSLSDCKEACKEIDYVFHQAALGSVPRSIDNPIATNNVNVNGFINMLVAARDAKVSRLVYASSSSVYGDSKSMPKVESVIGRPLSPYAVTKLTNEYYAEVFVKTYDIEVVGLRYFNVFGPNQNPAGDYAAAIPLFMEAMLLNKSPFINGDGLQTRDFTFVENAVEANIRSAFTENKDAIGKVFNVAVGEQVSIKDLVDILKEVSGSEVEAIHREARQGDVRDSLADISLAKDLLSYDPQVKVKDGLKITFDWFKKNYELIT